MYEVGIRIKTKTNIRTRSKRYRKEDLPNENHPNKPRKVVQVILSKSGDERLQRYEDLNRKTLPVCGQEICDFLKFRHQIKTLP